MYVFVGAQHAMILYLYIYIILYTLIFWSEEITISNFNADIFIKRKAHQSIPSSNIDPPSSLQMVMNHLWKWVEVEWSEWSSKWLDMFHDNVMMEMLLLFCRDWWILDDRQSLRFKRVQGKCFEVVRPSHLPPAFYSQLAISKPQHFTTSCDLGCFGWLQWQLYDAIWQTYDYITHGKMPIQSLNTHRVDTDVWQPILTAMAPAEQDVSLKSVAHCL